MNYTIFDATKECFNQGGVLMTFKSMDSLKSLLHDIIPYLPYNIKHLAQKKWFGGVFINPVGLLQSTATGEFLKDPMLNPNEDIIGEYDSSCMVAFLNDDGTLEIKRDSCIAQHYFLCEQLQGVPKPVGIKKELKELIKEGMVKKLYNHTTNSLSACSAYCGKNKMVFRGSDCVCFDDFEAKEDEMLDECHQTLPCPGNILQPCGCKLENESIMYPIFIEVTSSSCPLLDFSSCFELRKQGVLMDYAFQNGTNNTIECNLWSKLLFLILLETNDVSKKLLFRWCL